MKKILIVDDSALFRDYLTKKLEKDFEIIQGANGLDAVVKMRNDLPDLVIMEYYLSRKSSMEVLREKKENPNTADIPVIMVSGKIDSEAIKEVVKFNVKKVFTKPLKIDSLMKTVSHLVNVDVKFDGTPCIIEAHFNDEILFIEISQGLNLEKIELLRYKITELLDLYKVNIPKVLIMMSNLSLGKEDVRKLESLLSTILEQTQTRIKYIKILTNSEFVKKFLASSTAYSGIGITDNLSSAMDDLLGIKPDTYAHDEVVHDKLLKSSAPKTGRGESIQLRFEGEKELTPLEKLGNLNRDITLGIVDDDIVIQELVSTVFSETGWNIKIYENGKKFIDDIGNNDFDLVFLDLMMPEMNGFQVLQHLKEKKHEFPVIVFSALSRKETVVKAVGFGIHSYLIKPLKPQSLMQKAAEVLSRNF